MLDDMQEERRLTSFSHGAGCGCKLGPDQLLEVMGSLQLPGVPPEVLVGVDTGDDAAVWALDEDRAIIATLDFFTPIVDDPYDWGRIAATNAMSDVYAMGGTPFLALNIVAWPVDDLPLSMLSSVLQGGVDAATNAGVAVLGGHSITDPEPKFGMVVLGSVDPAQMTTNAGAQPGDTVFLTKPMGLGMISTAAKRGVATDEQLQVALDTMTTLNADAAAAMIRGRGRAPRPTSRVRAHGPPVEDAAGLGRGGDPRRRRRAPAAGRAGPGPARRRGRRDQAEPRLGDPHHRLGSVHASRAVRAGRCADQRRVADRRPRRRRRCGDRWPNSMCPIAEIGLVTEGSGGAIEVRGRFSE